MTWYLKENENERTKIGNTQDVIEYLKEHNTLEKALMEYAKEHYDVEDILHDIWYNNEDFSEESLSELLKEDMECEREYNIYDNNGNRLEFKMRQDEVKVEMIILADYDDLNVDDLKDWINKAIPYDIKEFDISEDD